MYFFFFWISMIRNVYETIIHGLTNANIIYKFTLKTPEFNKINFIQCINYSYYAWLCVHYPRAPCEVAILLLVDCSIIIIMTFLVIRALNTYKNIYCNNNQISSEIIHWFFLLFKKKSISPLIFKVKNTALFLKTKIIFHLQTVI